jgi:hypothetical protein
MRTSLRSFVCLVVGVVFATTVHGAPVSPEGEKLIAFLDSMHVEEHWIAGAIVDWRTGEPTGQPIKDDGRHTHCSQFAAAACERLGVYLLRPPEHRATLLANAQYDWLPAQGQQKGWSSVKDGKAAQELANQGVLVVAVYKNGDPKKSGHIAIIRPSAKSAATIEAEGPEVTQAGGTNHNSCSLRKGFGNHPGAFKNREIRFYSHAATLPATR